MSSSTPATMHIKPDSIPGYEWVWGPNVGRWRLWTSDLNTFIGVRGDPEVNEVICEARDADTAKKAKPEDVVGCRWDWCHNDKVWKLCQNRDDVYLGKHCFVIGNEGSPLVNHVIRKAKEKASPAEATSVGTPPIEESVEVDELVPAEAPVVHSYTTPKTAPQYPADTMIQNIEDMPGYKEGYARGKNCAWPDVQRKLASEHEITNAAVKKMTETEAKLCEQERETARLSSNIEQLEKEHEETNACLKSTISGLLISRSEVSDELEKTKAELCEQTRETARLGAKLEQEERDHIDTNDRRIPIERELLETRDELEKTKAELAEKSEKFKTAVDRQVTATLQLADVGSKLSACRTNLAKEQDLKHKAEHALAGALNARKATEAKHADKSFNMEICVIVLVVLIAFLIWLVAGLVITRSECKAALADLVQSYGPVVDALGRASAILKPTLAKAAGAIPKA